MLPYLIAIGKKNTNLFYGCFKLNEIENIAESILLKKQTTLLIFIIIMIKHV